MTDPGTRVKRLLTTLNANSDRPAGELTAPAVDADALAGELAVLEADLPRTAAAIGAGVRRGLQPGVQLEVLHRGVTRASWACGHATAARRMSVDTLLPVYCCTKVLTVLAFGQQWDAERWEPDTPVADVVPEFGRGGKERMTFRHLLTHTSALFTDITLDPIVSEVALDPDDALARICAVELPDGAVPGRQVSYGMFWAWFLLAVALERVTGEPFAEYVRAHLIEPLDLRSTFLGLTDEEMATHGDRLGWLFQTDPGASVRTPFVCTQPGLATVPGAGAVAAIGDVSALVAVLARGGRAPGGQRLLSSPAAAALTARHRSTLLDEPHGGYVDWTLGMTGEPSFLGSYCSPRTFGHKGLHSSCVLADPEHDLVIGIFANGNAGQDTSNARDHEIVDAVYADLDLTSPARRTMRVSEVEAVPARRP